MRCMNHHFTVAIKDGFLVSSALARRHLWKSAKNFEKYFIYHKLRGHTSKATLKYTFCDGRHEGGKKMLTKKMCKQIDL